MASLSLSGRVIYGQPFGPFAVGVPNATVEIFDLDDGGDGHDRIFQATTDTNGNFDGASSEWFDENSVATRIPQPPRWKPGRWVEGHWEPGKFGGSVWVPGYLEPGTWEPQPDLEVAIPIPDILAMQIKITYNGVVEEYPYFQGPGRATVTVSGVAPSVCLPVDDPAPVVRNAEIAARALHYPWAKDPEDPLPRVGGAPWEELPPPVYVAQRSAVEASILANYAAQEMRLPFDPLDSIGEYDTLLPASPAVQRPSALDNDEEFARQRVQGVNPLVIEAWPKETPKGCNFSDKDLAPYGLTIAKAVKANRLFVCDYGILQNVHVSKGRHFYAPFAIFLATSEDGAPTPTLKPIAIQVERDVHDASRTEIIPPKHERWSNAKLAVQMADLNYHELKSHLFECHLVMEGFAVAAARKFSPRHPIYVLLRSHFNLLLHQNIAARNLLVNNGGNVDTLLGTGITGARQIVGRARESWTFADAALRANLTRRGISTTPETQFTYPYRDDAILLWDAIAAHATRWVERFYNSDARVAGDLELQAWRKEAMSPEGGDLGKLPTLNDRASLVSMLTQIVFTCTAQHSAVNYPQFRYMANVPNMPASLRQDWLEAREPFFMLPRGSEANGQVRLSSELSLYQYDRLGQYTNFQDARLLLLASQFQSALIAVGEEISRRNSSGQRSAPYEALHPAMIANSISI